MRAKSRISKGRCRRHRGFHMPVTAGDPTRQSSWRPWCDQERLKKVPSSGTSGRVWVAGLCSGGGQKVDRKKNTTIRKVSPCKMYHRKEEVKTLSGMDGVFRKKKRWFADCLVSGESGALSSVGFVRFSLAWHGPDGQADYQFPCS